jgi:uncharacterized protein YbjT (DUF2867 family)
VDVSEILVTGGTGSLGRRVVDRLREADRCVRVLSRSGRPGTVQGDLLTGEGLERAVDGVGTMVHCASNRSRRTDVDGTELLLRAAEQADVSRFVYVSIVGVDRNPHYFYYRVKRDAEKAVERSPVPWTILRATQFHEFVLKQIQFLERGPFVLVPKGFLLQPIDVGEAADRLAELALSEPEGRALDVGGPEVRTCADLARSYLEAAGRRRRVVEVPLPGKMARAFREGAHLCPDRKYGRIRWEEFLHEAMRPSRGASTHGRTDQER